jgi:hypothetical protein
MSDHHSTMPEAYPDERPVLLSHVAATLRRYRVVIALAISAVVFAYLILATLILLLGKSQTIASLPFRLEFDGADRGRYPNGLKFSVADITANPVLIEVHQANDLIRFVEFEPFSRAIYVLEANRALEQLMAEYQFKLADAKLTPVDRERLEREYESKRASISKSDYAVQFLINKHTRNVPKTLVRKILSDILDVWARRAAIEKKVLEYQVPVLSTNIFDRAGNPAGDYLIPLLLLRRRVDDVNENLKAISDIPGAELIRTTKDKVSTEELRLRLDEVVRFRLEPLIARARAGGQLGANATALQVLRAQLAYDERVLGAARMREDALRNALMTYESQNPIRKRPERTTTTTGTTPATPQNPETVMPQLSESFLDRIVDLTSRNTDREYRQKLTDEIKRASLDVIPAEAAVRYDRELIDAFESGTSRSDGTAAALDLAWKDLLEQMRSIVADMSEIHRLASSQLNSSTELFRPLGAVTFRVERSISPKRLALTGLLVLLISVPMVIAAILIHNKIREEEAVERESTIAAETA